MNDDYESINVPGMYFAGALAHGKDFKRAAGGFIHGFRYTAKALFHVLSERHHEEPWPGAKTFEMSTAAGRTGLLDHLFSRINSGSGPYQMVGALGDGIVLRCDADSKHSDGTSKSVSRLQAVYLPEVPVGRFNSQFRESPRLLFTFGYNGQKRSFQQSTKEGTQFQAWLWYYPAPSCATAWDGTQPSPPLAVVSDGSDNDKEAELFASRKEVFRMVENLHTNWSSPVLRMNALAWFEQKIGLVTEGTHWIPKLKPDPTLQPPASAVPSSEWNAGLVDTWVKNQLPNTIALYKNGISAGTIKPYAGAKYTAQDRDKWTAKTVDSSGEEQAVVWRWTSDVARGIVQDVVVLPAAARTA
jgi:hypothetical protein